MSTKNVAARSSAPLFYVGGILILRANEKMELTHIFLVFYKAREDSTPPIAKGIFHLLADCPAHVRNSKTKAAVVNLIHINTTTSP